MIFPMGHRHAQDRAATQAKEDQKLDEWKAASWFLAGRLGIALLILLGVGQLSGGTVGYLDRTSLKLALPANALAGRARRVGQGLLQPILGQAVARLDISRGAFIDGAPALSLKERLHGADDLTAGGPGFEHLPQETFKGQPEAENAVTAVGSLVRRRKQFRGKQLPQLQQKRRKIQLAQVVEGAPALGGQLGAQGGEEGSNNH